MPVDRNWMNSGPLFHIGTFMPNLATFVSGGANVFVRRSDGEELCRAIDRYRCTDGFVLGPMVDAIVTANADGRYDLSSFRGKRGNPQFDVWVSADTSPWGRRAGGYGQTETMGMATFNLLGVDAQGLHGRPSPLVDLRVVGPEPGTASSWARTSAAALSVVKSSITGCTAAASADSCCRVGTVTRTPAEQSWRRFDCSCAASAAGAAPTVSCAAASSALRCSRESRSQLRRLTTMLWNFGNSPYPERWRR